MKRTTVGEKLVREGAVGAADRGLGEMPLTLFVIVAAVVLYFYLRRASLGIDLHPAERPSVRVGRGNGAPPVLPRIPGTPGAPVRLQATVGGL